MTAWQKLAARFQPPSDQAESEDPWENAPVPAQVARRVAAGLLGWQLSPERIPLLTNAMHWGYGTSWGVPYGLWSRGHRSARPLPAGAVFGASVWGMSYVQLVPMGLYEPPWRYPVKELALDLSYHLVYGTGTAFAFALLPG
jgi:hypothetical protein